MSLSPADLRGYKAVPAPRYKKDYEDKLLRVHSMPTVWSYGPGYEKLEKPDTLVPDGSVLSLRRRYTSLGGTATLTCDWFCPCCGHRHQRDIPESYIDEGKVEFVEECGTQKPQGFVYLACPYTHADPKVRQDRWLAASLAAAGLMAIYGHTVFSPISMGHPICVLEPAVDPAFSAWKAINMAMLGQATDLIVLLVDGVEQSAGVRAEIGFARERGIQVWGMMPGKNADGAYHCPQPLTECEGFKV